MKYKLGLIHPRHTLRGAMKMAALAPHLAALGAPPASSFVWADAVEKVMGGNDWLMLGNDKIGDCVIADNFHHLMICTANGAGPMVKPTDADAEALYSAITGYNPNDPTSDAGTDPSVNLTYMEQTGALGHKYTAGAQIDVHNMSHIYWGLHLFGGLRFCIQCPDFVDEQFERTGVWDFDGQLYDIQGGHDIRAVGYSDAAVGPDGAPFIEVVTWGKRIVMTQRFWEKFGIMAEADVSPDVIQATGVAPTGLNLQAMLDDLKAVQ